MSSVFFRAFEADDYLLINKWRNDPEIQKLTGGTFRYVSSEREKEWVRDKIVNNITDIYLAICLNDETKRMIGYCSINNINYIHRIVSGGGLIIGEHKYRDGYTYIETMLMFLSYVFGTLNMNRVSCTILEDQKVSYTMALLLHFKQEGLMRQSVYKNGKYHNEYILSILRDEYYDLCEKGEYEISSIIKNVKRK